MEKFVIEGGHPLHGTMTPSGNKNESLPVLAACILTAEPIILHNVPDILDVRAMCSLLTSLGVEVTDLGNGTLRVHARSVQASDLDPDLCRQIRASILLAGPMVARAGEIKLPPPGGDVIGRRRLDTHILALEALGVDVTYDRMFTFKTRELVGSNILLDEASVTAKNAIMACALAKTFPISAMQRPNRIFSNMPFINAMGGKVDRLNASDHRRGWCSCEFTIGPDIWKSSALSALPSSQGFDRVKNAGNQYLDLMLIPALACCGNRGRRHHRPGDQALKIQPDLGGVIPESRSCLAAFRPTDGVAIVVATQSEGTILFHDWMYQAACSSRTSWSR